MRLTKDKYRNSKMEEYKIILTCVCIVIILLIGSYIFLYDTVYETKTFEVGTELNASEFAKYYPNHTEFTSDITHIDHMNPGEHTVCVKNTFFTHECKLIIVDNVAPKASSVDINWYITDTLTPEKCVVDVFDATPITYEFLNEIDMNSYDKQEVKVRLSDTSGNITDITSYIKLIPLVESITIAVGDELPIAKDFLLEADPNMVCITDISSIDNMKVQEIPIQFEYHGDKVETALIIRDMTAPVITCIGGEIRNIVRESIAYKKSVEVQDNCDETVEIQFDNSEVDINTIGEYNLYCTATDSSGNIAKETFKVIIYEEDSMEAKVYEMADAVLEEIINDSMTEREIVETLFWYCKWNIHYTGDSDKSNWVVGAYEGLKHHSGDCYTYATVAKVLLTRAGITNKDIHKIPAETQHFWNLVDYGEGWIHFDSCPRADGTVVFLWTTEEVLEYSNTHELTHNFDKNEYPELFQ